jgi:anti-sigma factor RsiW
MTYRHTVHLHGDYLEGHLTRDQKGAVDEHLSGCSACRTDLEALVRLKDALGRIQAPDPGDEYFAGLEATVMSLTQPSPTEPVISPNSSGAARRTLRTLIRLVAAVTLLFSAFYISDIRQENLARHSHVIPATGSYAGTQAADSLGSQIQPVRGINVVGAPSPDDTAAQPPDSSGRKQ